MYCTSSSQKFHVQAKREEQHKKMGPDTAALVEIKAGQNVMAIVISNVFIDFPPLLILLGAKNSKSEKKVNVTEFDLGFVCLNALVRSSVLHLSV